LFFAAYSPNDERMGKFRGIVSGKGDFEVYLEDLSFYQDTLREQGFVSINTETIGSKG